MKIQEKFNKLKKIIAGYGSALVAFSGGVDSSFLAYVASGVLSKDKLLAITAVSETYPAEELKAARVFAKKFGLRLQVIKTAEFKDKRFVANPVDRCYYCKSELFNRLRKIARERNLNAVLDATSLSDKADYRPGSRAKKECGVFSPLVEAGFTKADIRILSRKFGLSTWDKPSLACLASRIPYGTALESSVLTRIHKAESFLRELGFKQVRLRHYGRLCRIEVSKEQFKKLADRGDLVVDKLKGLGYNYVTLDLEGFRSGSMNEILEDINAKHLS